MADVKQTVNCESVIHEAITRALQNIADEFGIRVTLVRAGWIDEEKVNQALGIVDRQSFTVSGVEIVSETGRR